MQVNVDTGDAAEDVGGSARARVDVCVFLCVCGCKHEKGAPRLKRGGPRGRGRRQGEREVVDAAAQARGAHTEWGGGGGLSLGMEAAFLRVGLKAECPVAAAATPRLCQPECPDRPASG